MKAFSPQRAKSVATSPEAMSGCICPEIPAPQPSLMTWPDRGATWRRLGGGVSVEMYQGMCPASSLYIRVSICQVGHSYSTHFHPLERERSFRERGSDSLFLLSLQSYCSFSSIFLESLEVCLEVDPSFQPGFSIFIVYKYMLTPSRSTICCILCHLARPVGTFLRGKPAPTWRIGTRNSPTSRPLLMAVWWLDSPEKISLGSRKRFPMSSPSSSRVCPHGLAASIPPPPAFLAPR